MEANKDREILFRSGYNLNFQINPSEYGIDLSSSGKSVIDLTSYNPQEFYREAMAPTSVSLGTDPSTNEKVAIKKIFKEELMSDNQKRQARQEFPLHCSLNHINIIKGLEWSENEDEYVLLMEYSNRAKYLTEKIQERYTPIKKEGKMKSFTYDILEGLNYLHKGGIIHGDIKLENILYDVDKEEKTHIMKLCDFGSSLVMDQSSGKAYMEETMGSKHYTAPEVKSKSYVNEKVDMWALGVVMYKMAVAYKPTQLAGYQYGKGPIPFRHSDWTKRSHELQDMIGKLLEVDPEKRISAHEALDHPWFHI